MDTRDPLSLSSFEDRNAAIEGKLKRLQANPEYQKLSPEARVETRAQIYNTYVVPTFKQAGVPVPDIKLWLHGTKESGIKAIDPNQQYRSEAGDVLGHTIVGAVHAGQELYLSGIKLTRAMLNMYTTGSFFGFAQGKDFRELADNSFNKANNTLLGRAQRDAQDGVHQTNFWLQTHPRGTKLATAGEWTGEQVVQLPLYEALGSISALGEGANVTSKLAKTGVGKFVAKRIGDAFDGFVSNMATSGGDASTKENLQSAVGFAVFGGAFEKASEWLAKVAARKGEWAATQGGAPKGLPAESRVLEGEYMPEPITAASDSAIKKWASEHVAMGGQPFAEDIIHSGFIELTAPVKQRELSASTRAIDRQKLDPTLAQLHDGEKMALQSLALRHYGQSLDSLPHDIQQKVLARRLELMHEATFELPVHLPDLAHAEYENEIAAEVKGNPELGKRMAEVQALSPKKTAPAQVMAKNQVKDIAEQTGIISKEAALNKADRFQRDVRGRFSKKGSYGLEEKASASFGPKDLAELHKNSVAYFKNPGKAGERRAADGTLIGGRDKRTWNERLKAENTKQFIETLKEGQGGGIKFEDPKHLMLFNWANRKELPEVVASKLRYELKKAYPNYHVKQLDAMADRGLVHLQMLAQSGRLAKGESVFNSTNMFGAPTEWQTALNTEIDAAELQHLKETIKMHPNGLKAMKGILDVFQSNRANSITKPEDWLMYNKVIQNILNGVIE